MSALEYDAALRRAASHRRAAAHVCGAAVVNIFTFHHLSISRENSTDVVMKEEMEMIFSLLTYRLRYASIKASKTTMLI